MNIICNLLLMLTLSLFLLHEYSIVQNYHYEFRKYLLHIKNQYKKYWYCCFFLLGIFLLKFEILHIFLSLILLFCLIKKGYKLHYTSRIKRIVVINVILLIIMWLTDTLKYVFIVPFLYLWLVHCFSLLIEKIVFLKYLKKAKSKVKDKMVIGITGSCGKTSVKNIVYDLLVNNFNVSKTPKSYNNRIGITKGINDNVGSLDEYFICEYGVDRVGGMDKLLKIVAPKIAIITEIGNQHLLSFKSVSNILKEKMKIIESLDSDGIGIINNDNEYLREYDYHQKTIFRYGIKYKSDVMAKNVSLSTRGSEFDLYIKGKYIAHCKIPLLSIHGVENVLCGICVCLVLDMSIEVIVSNLKNLNVVEHRLENKIINEIEIIDDSFNSNEKGFLEALDILKTSSKYKIIITPGIIEQGKNNALLNYNISKKIMGSVDYVYLVSDNSKYMEECFKEHNYDKYRCFKSFVEAFEDCKKIDKEKIILIENDLPNIYLK